ncbi:MAG: transcription-repair coupling factor [Bacteroidaceae bacterium]|nr:transcription-repair coupling factor [Bacteroidaceae bacterium]
MQIQDIQARFARHPAVKALGRLLGKSDDRCIALSGLQGSAAPLAFASLAVCAPQVLGVPFVFVMNDAEEAGYFYHDLVQVLGEESVLCFPSSFRRAAKYGQRDVGNEILRTDVLSRIDAGGRPLFIVTSPDAMAEQVVTRRRLSEQTLTLSRGERVDVAFVQETLAGFGFRRVDYVYEPGQFAVRGGIIDVYSFSNDYPFRIDFFGDEVDSLRTFDVQTQLSLDRCDSITIVPELSAQSQSQAESFLAFLPADSLFVLRDMAFLCDEVERIYGEGFSQQAIAESEAVSDDEAPVRPLVREQLLTEPSRFRSELLAFRRIHLAANPIETCSAVVRFQTHPQPPLHKNFDLVCQVFRDYIDRGYDICILADSEKQTDRLESIFHDKAEDIHFTPVRNTIHAGFADDDLHLCLFTDHQIFDRFHKYNLRSERTRSSKVALTLKELRQFEVGDFVVHADHGVGRFGGLVSIPNGDQMQEVIKIIYKNDDVVFVSIHSLHKVSKYKGREGEPPRLSALGTGAWERMKERTKSKIKDIARDLIKLYSRRLKEKGFSYSPDSFMQHELEASFLYEDTPDQLQATIDVKADMERPRPMDRLVCGDVGFGKTEVAIRAAFKACADNKQVAVLVPTTVLAYQHFRTFTERLAEFPVTVDYLSRARTATQTREILEGLRSGRINIIIGTHKLLGRTVRFHDLGLLIIDEEQKFGVSTKEKLRQMRTSVDTLTLTATPIPRTLQFSLMGARDLSVIQTPPPNRHPIQTLLSTFSSELITEAINFELSRDGQVFFVNDRISNLPDLEALLRRCVPDARIVVAHGQMPPAELEHVMLDFAAHEYDVLVSTSIIESGLDIPNANTIIINAAQHFGLSDLHQMRGRVGRSAKKAFCYLLAPPLSQLPSDARRRLQAIEQFSDLGSGIHLAMQDLDIRGAGNLLGAEQSGFIADLGYETYRRILDEAVQELRVDEFPDLFGPGADNDGAQGSDSAWTPECLLESDLPMSFPDEYVPGSGERMMLYRELDGLERQADVDRFCQQMQDRFGPIPPQAEELIRVVPLRRLGRRFGVERIVLKRRRMRLYFVARPDSTFYSSHAFGQLIAYASTNAYRCRLQEVDGRRSLLVSDVGSVADALAILQQAEQIKV